jgi:hypothetical protein
MGNRTILNITQDTSFADALEKIYTKAYDDAGCMIWTGSTTASGYGRIVVDGKATTVRRVLAEKMLDRALRKNEFAASTCNDKRCVCAEHVRVVTVSARRAETGAAGGYSSRAKGAKIAQHKRENAAKLQGGQVAADAIRCDSRPSHEVAPEHGISASMVRRIRQGLSWKPLNSPFAGLGARA